MTTPAPTSNRLVNAIAVGCLGFAAKIELAKESHDFFKKLETVLEAIENLTELEIADTNSQFGTVIQVNSSKDSKLYFPHIYNSSISFKLYIPFKTQDSLGFLCDTESFKVLIVHHYHFPVTYLLSERDEISDNTNTTLHMALVREYLKSKIDGSSISFFCVGPSPFHAYFEGLKCTESHGLYSLDSKPGYKRYRFQYTIGEGSAILKFCDAYGDILSLFYVLHLIRCEILDLDYTIAESVKGLVSATQSRWGLLKGYLKSSEDISFTLDNILKAESRRQHICDEIENAEKYEPVYSFRDLEYHFHDLKMTSRPRTYANERQILETFERRSLSFIQNSAVMISGLLGGIIGALVADMF